MKKALLILAIVIYFGSNLFGQWIWQNPMPASIDMNQVVFSDKNTGWVVGEPGYIIKTTDGGETWFHYNIGKDSVCSIFFVDSLNGWAAGYSDPILHTTDGGNSWILQYSQLDNYIGKRIFFLNKDVGWIIGSFKGIMKTTDGGANWHFYSSSGFYSLNDIHFLDENTGWGVGQYGRLMKTEDSGLSWFEYNTGLSEDLYSICFIDSAFGWAAGWHFVFRTTNGGTSWAKFNPFNSTNYSIYFADKMKGWLAGTYKGKPVIYKTTDGGYNWTESLILQFYPYHFYSISFTDTLTGVAVGSKGMIYKTTDGGNTWLPKTINVVEGFTSVFFINESKGWASGNDLIAKTTDGGNTWTIDNLNLSIQLKKVQFLDDNLGWAFGWSASQTDKILKTTDGGHYWSDIYSSSIKDLFFVNPNVGYLAASGSRILKSIDGGFTWNEVSFTDQAIYNSVYFIDENRGWAAGTIGEFRAGYNGLIKGTLDGGQNWFLFTSSQTKNILKIKFIDELNGWALSNTGILGSTNGGQTWNFLSSVGGNDFQFLDYNNGFIVGNKGEIFYTSNGGNTWEMQKKITSNNLVSVFFVNNNSGWAAGEYATILKYDTLLTSISTDDKIQKLSYNLFQNYPNPFNPTTTIRFSIPFVEKGSERSFGHAPSLHTTLKIFNLLGREIATLVNEPKSPGVYEVIFNAEGLSSGVYLYRLTVIGTESKKEFRGIKKMVLIR
jgi:photosystem II stability/assembly factor-like uncharacterized protein